MTDTGRTLLLMRHAEAEGFASADRSRRLTDQGRRAATEVGRWLAAEGLTPDAALVSSAARAQETWAGVEQVLASGVPAQVEDALYAAGEEGALESLRGVDAGVSTVLWVGHNPTVALLAQSLSDESPDEDAFTELTRGYPPAAVTVLDVPGQWADLADGRARVRGFHVGRG